MAIILDTPESRWYSLSSNKIHFIPLHQFSPLVDFTMGGWSLQVALEDVDINANNKLILKVLFWFLILLVILKQVLKLS